MLRCAVLCALYALPLVAWCQPASSPRGVALTASTGMTGASGIEAWYRC